MAQSTIHDHVQQALQAQGLRHYSAQAQPVVDALVKREEDLMTGIVQAAVAQGVSQEDAEALLQDLGAHVSQAVQAQGVDESDVQATLASINESLNGLLRFARANGFQD